jgi:ATP-dependent Lon protease
MDALDQKLVSVFDGKVVRKDLLHRIKKGTNVPTFVLEFLLARYCASDDAAEIQAGMEAVLATLQDNYVRPDEANAAQSKVATKGKHRFIDKVHVRYVEKEKHHWAALGILIRNVLPSANASTGRTIACWRVASGRK